MEYFLSACAVDKSQIHLSDWYRILIGEAPLAFLVEVVVRVTIVYALVLVAVRLLGKRMSGQLTSIEMAVMLTLGKEQQADPHQMGCNYCGQAQQRLAAKCPDCGHKDWVSAVG